MAKRSESSQKFIARNRAPRVQIEYDVELYGAQQKVELPFVMGVMADLSGDGQAPSRDKDGKIKRDKDGRVTDEREALPEVADRKFLEIDIDNFDKTMEGIKPRVAFNVPNLLSEEGGNLAVAISFEKMSDFSPESIAKQVEPLRKLLEARTKLSNLLTYMDGKSGAETALDQLLANPALMKSVLEVPKAPESAAPADGTDSQAAPDSEN